MSTSPESLNNNTPREPVKYRTSCDRCQNIKLRCSQDKPACRRCASKGLRCVYSPLRRIGRPRKVDQITPLVTSLDGNTPAPPETMISTPGSSSLSDSQPGHSDGPGTDFTSIGSGTTAATTPQNDLRSWDSGISEGLMIDLRPQTSHPHHPHSQAQSTGDEGTRRPGLDTCAPLQASSTGAFDARPPGTCSGSTFQSFAADSIIQDAPGLIADCYTAILARTAKLERSLVTAPRAPPIDLVLEAERDLRLLKQRLFSCGGHSHNGRDCLASDRPVLLSLSLLAERVVTMLEETFRFAAATATATSAAIQDSSGNPLPTAMARRLERSFRGLLDQPCVFPIPAGNLDIRIGNYVVDGPVKARSVKGILQMRIRKLLGALDGIRRTPRRNTRRDSLGGPLDWGGSSAVLDDAAGLLVQDLIRRMEALQGGMALMG
ncbi:hypothetical protein AAE478_007199 [Parahypoxylon ruwenzoriense]